LRWQPPGAGRLSARPKSVTSAPVSDDREPQAAQSARLLRALIWAGVGLAPVAAVVVLLGATGNAARIAVVLIAVCVVLIGASMLVRSDPVMLAMDVEDRVAEEADALREELRAEFAATHQRVQSLQEEIARLRGGAGAAPDRSGPGSAGRAAGGDWPNRHHAASRPDPDAASEWSPPDVPRQRAAASIPMPMAPVFQPPALHRRADDPERRPRPAVYGTPAAPPAAQRPHKRRADVTAVDLGYTGRRAKPDEAGRPPAGRAQPNRSRTDEAQPHRPRAEADAREDDEDGYWRRLADRDNW
jgi:hypothetical protein